MNTPFSTSSVEVAEDQNDLFEARESAFANLGFVQHYAGLMRGFLEVGDDAGAIYAYQHLREYMISAARDFQPCRAAFGQRVGRGEGARDA